MSRASVVRARPKVWGLPVLVGEHDLGEIEIEMAGGRRKVHRLERTATFLVDDVQHVNDPHIVAHLGIAAGATAAVEIHDIGRTADRGKDQVALADPEIALGIAGGERE